MNKTTTEDGHGVPRRGFFGILGPSIIVAAVVLGPGSVLTTSKVGCKYGYEMIWVPVIAGILMMAMVALASRIGVVHTHTPCEEIARRLGRPIAAMIGIIVFLVVAAFQSSNNIAVIASVEPLLHSEHHTATSGSQESDPGETGQSSKTLSRWQVIFLLLFMNLLSIGGLYFRREFYRSLEGLMKLLVGLMLVGFGINLLVARPDLLDAIAGLVPQIPEEASGGLLPSVVRNIESNQSRIVDPLWAVQGLIATTFSVAGAFFQAYLVRAKKWTTCDLRRSWMDSIFGIGVLVFLSLVIMMTSAAVLHGRISADEITSAADIARQLQPLFGRSATVLFCLGLFAGAFSSFLVNAMIGGTLLADGLGLGSSIDAPWAKRFTVAALFVGMAVAIASEAADVSRVNLIIFAQALTVVGVPMIAAAIIYLATRPDVEATPRFLLISASIGGAVTLFLAIRTGWKLILTFSL